jgi:hypothetical protein
MDWKEVWVSFTRMDYRFVAAALSLNLASVFFRVIRWRILLQDRFVSSWGKLTVALLVGQAVNVVAPARLGDLARATLISAEGAAYTLGTIALEGFLDLLMLAALALFSFSRVALPIGWQKAGRGLLATAGIVLVAMVLIVAGRRWIADALEQLLGRWQHPLAKRAWEAIDQTLTSLRIMRKPSQFLIALVCTISIWALYGAVNYVLFEAVSTQVPLLVPFFLLVVLQLGVAVPSSPGRIGVFHYLCVQTLALFGLGGAMATSYAVMLHLISVVTPMALGTLLAWRLGVAWGDTSGHVANA